VAQKKDGPTISESDPAKHVRDILGERNFVPQVTGLKGGHVRTDGESVWRSRDKGTTSIKGNQKPHGEKSLEKVVQPEENGNSGASQRTPTDLSDEKRNEDKEIGTR